MTCEDVTRPKALLTNIFGTESVLTQTRDNYTHTHLIYNLIRKGAYTTKLFTVAINSAV
jgi:hypothetical protein